MSERTAFINAILDNPTDDTARLVFADWLEERGERERAEFIRLQIEADKSPTSEHHRNALRARTTGVEAVHGATWRAAVGIDQRRGVYERGFLTKLEFLSTLFPILAEALLTVEPVTVTIHLVGQHEDDSAVTLEEIDEFASDPYLRAVTKISSQGGFGRERFVRLMKSPYLINLREIDIFQEPLGADGIEAVVNAPASFKLESLTLNEALQDDSGDEGRAVELLATSPRFASLKALGLMFNELTDESIRVLLASKTLPRTMRIELEDNAYDEEEFAESLAARFGVESDGDSGDE
ncbi:hypothetical protein VT84_20690 [Gemmata sp. SH-PL17]|uniref:TIGR02996 domain-containing protein n=1 Tax=Gemmata sp. SH-PL17 TaxID=1630693 RepID=UPI00078E5F2E|nr:TIGR02996 domain-containing protein [Gemmata sp. SH-PL17]AMV26830.1 hypothetical protein VT84_20690 [Gemmata sp. SH-PL17]